MNDLTPRQRQIAEHVAMGLSSKAIAKEVGISVETVERHIRDAAGRVPGNGPPRYRLMFWVLDLQNDSS